MARLELRGVAKRFGGTSALDGVDLSVRDGELLALVGPSGSGKTTLLRVIAGLERPDAGTVLVDGSEPTRQGGIGMVFESDAVYEHLDVAGNVRFPLEISGFDKAEADQLARRRSRRLGVVRLWRRRPHALSSGERGLVAMARALSRGHLRLLLLDEPLAKADLRMRARFRAEMRRLLETESTTTVLATNDPNEAMAVADRIAVLLHGKVVQVGTPAEVYHRPVNVWVAELIGPMPMNLLPGTLRLVHDEWRVVVGSDELEVVGSPAIEFDRRRVLVGLHTGHLTHADAATPFRCVLHATASTVRPVGSAALIGFGIGSAAAPAFFYQQERPTAVRPGDRLELTWAPDRMRLFDAATGETIPM